METIAASSSLDIGPVEPNDLSDTLKNHVDYSLSMFDEVASEYVIHLPNHTIIKQPMVNSQLVQELLQVLSDRIETCHMTCISLCDKKSKSKIDNFAELKTIANDLLLIEDFYTQRQARYHVLHISDLCCCSPYDDIYDGMIGNSASAVFYLSSLKNDKLTIPDPYLLPNSSDSISLSGLCIDLLELDKCVFEISFGMWNPPLSSRRLAGDLLYVRIHTLENRIIHVTACANGFFVNKSTDEVFDAQAVKKSSSSIYHTLVDLLQVNSQLFKRNWSSRMEKRFSQNPLLKIPCSIPVFNWFCKYSSPSANLPTANSLRSSSYCNEIGLLNDMTMSSISPIGQLRDWNEEIQLTRQTFFQALTNESLSAHRAAFRVHSDFVLSAVRTAKSVVDGQIPPVNPSEHWNSQMFIWNNLFISMAFDVRDHYKDCGGDIAAHYASKSDLRGIEYFVNRTSPDSSLCTVGTVLIDYMGFRVAVQSIVPGILEKEQDQSIAYGSIDFGKSFICNTTYHDKLMEVSEKLHLKSHIIKTKEIRKDNLLENENGDGRQDNGIDENAINEVNVIMPIEVKGIVGNDNRQYILDLIRINPPDLNFLNSDSDKYEHDLVSIRPELLDHFCSVKRKCFVSNIGHPSVKVIACNEDTDSLRELCSFIITNAIPNLLIPLLEEERPLDGQHLVEILHKCGINVRYLPHVITTCEENENLSYIATIARAELICRCAKHVFRRYSQLLFKLEDSQSVHVPYVNFATHFLNSFVGITACSTVDNHNTIFNGYTKKQKRNMRGAQENTSCLTEKRLWTKISEDALLHFKYILSASNSSIDAFVTEFNISKLGLVRRLCQMTGIQIRLCENGNLWNNNGFSTDQIINMNPVIHHIRPPLPKELDALINNANESFINGDIQSSYLKINCAYNALMSLYGPIHESVAHCLRLLAKLNFMCCDPNEAFNLQQRATMITERLKGLDSSYAAYDYCTLAHYCFAAEMNNDSQLGVKLMLRARHIARVASPMSTILLHPRVIKIDASLAVMFQSAGAYSIATTYSRSLLERTDNEHNIPVLDRALFYNINSRIYCCLGKLADAINYERKAFQIYKQELGKDNIYSIQSHEFIRSITKQRVMLERYRGSADNKISSEDIPFVQTFEKFNAVDLLNIINTTKTIRAFISTNEQNFELLKKLFNITIDKDYGNNNIERNNAIKLVTKSTAELN